MNTNKVMREAQRNKKDEFYTQLKDIEVEMEYYKPWFLEHLEHATYKRYYNRDDGKTVICPCDGPDSAFVEYFLKNFKELHLKELIAFCYNPEGKGMMLRYDGSREFPCPERPWAMENMDAPLKAPQWEVVDSDCDFRSDFVKETIKGILYGHLVIVTNPPFSLFREFITWATTFPCHLICLGNMNAILTKDVFKFVRDGRLSYGRSISSGDRAFRVPQDYEGSGVYEDLDRNKYIKVKGVRWFTTLRKFSMQENNPMLELKKSYRDGDYRFFDYLPGVLNVDRTEDIPNDYYGPMGVPLTFLDKWNRKQFVILDGINRYLVMDHLMVNDLAKANKWHLLTVDGKQKYFRIMIQRVRKGDCYA